HGDPYTPVTSLSFDSIEWLYQPPPITLDGLDERVSALEDGQVVLPELRDGVDAGTVTGTFLDVTSDLALPDVTLVFESVGFASGAFWSTPTPVVPGAQLVGVNLHGIEVDWGSTAGTGVSVALSDGMS